MQTPHCDYLVSLVSVSSAKLVPSSFICVKKSKAKLWPGNKTTSWTVQKLLNCVSACRFVCIIHWLGIKAIRQRLLTKCSPWMDRLTASLLTGQSFTWRTLMKSIYITYTLDRDSYTDVGLHKWHCCLRLFHICVRSYSIKDIIHNKTLKPNQRGRLFPPLSWGSVGLTVADGVERQEAMQQSDCESDLSSFGMKRRCHQSHGFN